MKWLLPTAIILIVVGLVGVIVFNYYSFTPSQPGTVRAPFRGPGAIAQGSFSSNGEQIFFTGTSSRDTITVTGGPFWFQMHDGGCANCHGPDGRGGTTVMMGRFIAPNITYKELQKEGFNNDLIKRAVTRGQDEKGGTLSSNMPRWHMSDQDLNDAIDYLKTLAP
ncbi:MAG: hypothetical protein COW32_03120 [Candidatus Aquicultor secundus]|uniref:Cytochrome c domain-containing protein n=1 Tax=Candidatus Aquicultor secundus TaxID=1973895 RepID=A0A2M7TBN3_9ACTN|nr:cytochrome c [Candidatus Aquicultor secundus]NCO66917.1 cytochrome c [Solirubrobacter sp.]OIO87953.1 MAG: hypothetical protein AUK32_02700 [Candidatus Aquicultor secundus]PIU26701.1 MAG: hypothetical protein COT10_07315 [Candidatus Aquicultor secundus]PIW22710.1 MAG: hypothetical protein COW32_03120 [Candidatus Aquicultor secundus]PIX51230.1 MAG: hypothetical protein COZ51_10765 [Candidatus Aquicultor secundus]